MVVGMRVSQKFIIGVDGGGTHCRATLQDSSGNVLGRAEAGPSNIMSDGILAMSSIISACKGAIEKSNFTLALSEVLVCAGVAGANVPEAKERFLAIKHPFSHLTVISDLHAACLGAHSGDEGALIICGTGSAGTVYRNNKFEDKGGYGLNVGDNASAAWLGKESVKYALLAFDGMQEKSELFVRLIAHLQVTTSLQLVQKVSSFTPTTYGKLAPLVVDAMQDNCDVSKGLILQGASYLSSLGSSLCSDSSKSLPLCIVGGMAKVYLPFIEKSIRDKLVTPKYDAQRGAIFHLHHQEHSICN